MNILVLKRDKLGDLLLTTPLFRALRSALPQARIDLLASDYNAWVAQGNPHLSEILVYPRVRIGRRFVPGAAWAQAQLFFQLRSRRYDWVIVAQGEDSPRAVKRALWTGARRVVSYVDPGHDYGPRLTDPLAPPEEGHEGARLLALLAPLGLTPDPSELAAGTEFVLPEEAATFARTWLADQRLAPHSYVVLGLGARRARKQPSSAQILRWSERIWQERGLKTVFMWTPGDAGNPLYPGDDAIAEPVLAAHAPAIVPFRGALKPALGLIWSARTSLFPDSGLMHFAAASPGGVVGLFGDEPDFALKWAPLGPRASSLRCDRVEHLPDAALFDALARRLDPL